MDYETLAIDNQTVNNVVFYIEYRKLYVIFYFEITKMCNTP